MATSGKVKVHPYRSIVSPRSSKVRPRRDDCYNTHNLPGVQIARRGAFSVRTDMVEVFQSTIDTCFNRTIENMMGASVKHQILQLLERSGIPRSQVGARFDDVVKVLVNAFGKCSRLLVYRTVLELYDEYSLRPTFGFYDSMRDQMILLRERVFADLLRPRHSPTIDDSIYIRGPSKQQED